MDGKTEKKKAKTRNRDAFKKPQAGRKVMAQLLLKFVLAGFFFFFSVQSGLNLGLGDYKFSKLREEYGQKELGALLKGLRLGKKTWMPWRDGFRSPKPLCQEVKKEGGRNGQRRRILYP